MLAARLLSSATRRAPSTALSCTRAALTSRPRHFSLTPRVLAEAKNPDFTNIPNQVLESSPPGPPKLEELANNYNAEIMKLMASPEAVQAIQDMKKILEDEGTCLPLHSKVKLSSSV